MIYKKKEVAYSEKNEEHFCTLFDSYFLPIGMALHESLMRHAQPFHLWILCMDDRVEQQLEQLRLPYATPVPLRNIETSNLLNVKQNRSVAEYCWTVTPFTLKMVFNRAPLAKRATYVDADVFFFDNPRILLQEMDRAEKSVLITEHAYAPENRYLLKRNGRFCVQFMPFRQTIEGLKVLEWWQERCIEWCFAKHEDGKFGDQKYLECWPERFSMDVHILRLTEKTLAPWNANYFFRKFGEKLNPVIYHFQGLRIMQNRVRLFGGYYIGVKPMKLYKEYLNVLESKVCLLKSIGFWDPILLKAHEDQSFWAEFSLRLRLRRGLREIFFRKYHPMET